MSGQVYRAKLAAAPLKVSEALTTLMLDVAGDHAAELEALQGKPLRVTFAVDRPRRSLSANALCWELCGQIASALTPPVSKDEVYRRAIRDVGPFHVLAVAAEAAEAFTQSWTANGTGWFVETAYTGEEFVTLMAYPGSSTYDTREMGRLIDWLIDEARQLELPIANELDEIERIKAAWRPRSDRKEQ